MNKVVALKADDLTNGAEAVVEFSYPYSVSTTIEGAAPILFHRWNCDAVEAKAKAAKGSERMGDKAYDRMRDSLADRADEARQRAKDSQL